MQYAPPPRTHMLGPDWLGVACFSAPCNLPLHLSCMLSACAGGAPDLLTMYRGNAHM